MIPKQQRLSDEELKKLIELYDSVKEKRTLIKDKLMRENIFVWATIFFLILKILRVFKSNFNYHV
ncbi:MAG: hypothetical protein ACP5UJ_08070 [Athalassotoga sp.]|uniref:hypothetical protein n=1 Tax=Bacteria TaxID=2 RepID=UPI003CFDCC33